MKKEKEFKTILDLLFDQTAKKKIFNAKFDLKTPDNPFSSFFWDNWTALDLFIYLGQCMIKLSAIKINNLTNNEIKSLWQVNKNNLAFLIY